MEDLIKKAAFELGADACGISDISRFKDAPEGFSPLDVYPECKSVITFIKALPKGLAYVSPRLIYCHYNEKNVEYVDEIAYNLSRFIEKEFDGAIAVPLPCNNPYDSWDKERMHGHGIISVKHAAVNCGLGALGKSTLLLNPQFGNMITVGIILSNLTLKSDDYCENICIKGCRKCIDNCPSGAICEDGTVIQKNCRINTYGENVKGFGTVNCNNCRTVCPMRFGK